jgi:hypothetical protein
MIFLIRRAWMPGERAATGTSYGRVVRKNERVRIYGPQSAKQGPGEKFSGLGRRGLPRIGFKLIAKASPRSGYGASPTFSCFFLPNFLRNLVMVCSAKLRHTELRCLFIV